MGPTTIRTRASTISKSITNGAIVGGDAPRAGRAEHQPHCQATPKNGLEPLYSVLDAGCGYGTVTQSRFGNDDRFEVVTIDEAEDVLEIAKDRYSAPNIEYRWLAVNNLGKANLGTFDIVFASYLFHHIANQESVLSLLWEHVRDDGVLAVRSCEDGQHMHYPPEDEMDWIVERTDEIPGRSDRTHGRRLPTHLKRLSPPPEDVWLDLKNYHTSGETVASATTTGTFSTPTDSTTRRSVQNAMTQPEKTNSCTRRCPTGWTDSKTKSSETNTCLTSKASPLQSQRNRWEKSVRIFRASL